jgi:cytochrome c biogenesis protein CcmG, thiol:disulfide interchange protein DsbE
MVTAEKEKRGLSGREVLYGAIGIFLGILVLSGVWLLTGNTQAGGPALSEVTPYDAPGFTLKTLDGGEIDLQQYKGKVVLLNFWGTWCEPCKEETPALQNAYEQLKDEGLVVIGVDLFDSERANQRGLADVQRFAALYGVTYPIALDETGSVGRSYAIAPIPTSYFIDQDGKVRYIRVGQLNTADVERIFRRLQSPDA